MLMHKISKIGDSAYRLLLARLNQAPRLSNPGQLFNMQKYDASAAGLRRHLRVKAFFDDPVQHPISPQELADYQQNHVAIDEEKTEFFFFDSTNDQD